MILPGLKKQAAIVSAEFFFPVNGFTTFSLIHQTRYGHGHFRKWSTSVSPSLWLCQFHVVVCSGTDIFYILHIIIDTFDCVIDGQNKSYQILTFFLWPHSEHGSKESFLAISSEPSGYTPPQHCQLSISSSFNPSALGDTHCAMHPDLLLCSQGHTPENNCTS